MNSFVLLSSAAFGLPVVQASIRETKSPSNGDAESTTKVKPTSLPLYPEGEKMEYTIQPPTKVETFIRDARVQAVKVKEEYQPVFDRVSHVVNTGKAHTSESIYRLREEDNLVGRVGFMAFGGLLGLFAARKGHTFKRITYLSAGIIGTGSVCYPREAKVLAADAGSLAAKNGRIAYHFVFGTRPPIQNENGKAFDKMANMVSDVWQWGFPLFEKRQPEVKLVEESAPEKPVLGKTEELPYQNKEDASPVPLSESEEPGKPSKAAETEGVQSAEIEISMATNTNDKPVAVDTLAQKSQTRGEAGTEAYQSEKTLTVVSNTSDQPIVVESSDAQAQVPAKVIAQISAQPPSDVIVTKPSTDSTSETPSDSDSGSTAKIALQLEGDLGQGNPEDKELYTTRE